MGFKAVEKEGIIKPLHEQVNQKPTTVNSNEIKHQDRKQKSLLYPKRSCLIKSNIQHHKDMYDKMWESRRMQRCLMCVLISHTAHNIASGTNLKKKDLLTIKTAAGVEYGSSH